LTYLLPAFATETRKAKHILEIKPVSWKNLSVYSVGMKQKSVKDPTKLELTNHGRKSIRKHMRNIQCQ